MGFALLLAGLLASAAVLVTFVQGPRLAAIVNRVLPAMKGRICFGSIRWRPRLLADLLLDRATPMVVEGLKITDPEGTVVLDVPNLKVAVRLRPLLSGGGIILSDLWVGPKSVWLFAKMKSDQGIGFLSAFDPEHPAPAPPHPPAKGEKGFVFQIANAELDGLHAVFDFPGVWGLDLRDIHAPASLLVDGQGFVGWDVVGLQARRGGYLRVMTEELPFDRVSVNRVATTRAWSDDIFLDLGSARTGASELVGKGFFTGIYGESSVGGIKIHVELGHAADALAAVALPHHIAGLHFTGDASLVGDLWDPYDTMKIKADLHGLDVGYQSYLAKDVVLRAGIGFATVAPTMTIKVDELSLASPAGGRCQTGLVMAGDALTATLGCSGFVATPYLPIALRKLAGGELQGHLGLAANIGAEKSIAIAPLDLRYHRAFRQHGLPSTVRLSGQVRASAESASSTGLRLEMPGASANISGKVFMAKRLVEVGLRATLSDLPKLLSSVGAPPVARSATVSVDLAGSMDRPRAQGQIEVRGIGGGRTGLPAVDDLQAGFRMRDGTVSIASLRAGVANGLIAGEGSAQLFGSSLTRVLSAPALDFRLSGEQIALEQLIAGGVVTGQVSFSLVASGTTRKPKIVLRVPPGTTVEVLGQPWRLQGIEVEVDRDAVRVKLCQAAGQGGELAIEGRIDLRRKPLRLTWHVKVSGVALAPILAAAKVAPAQGQLDLDLNLDGTIDKPLLGGTIVLSGVRAFGLDLGKAALTLTPTADGSVLLAGDLFRRFRAEGTLKASARGLSVTALLSFVDLHLDELVPGLTAQGIAATVSGQLRVAVQPDRPPTLDLTLTGLEAAVVRALAQADGSTARQSIWVRNATPLHVSTDTHDLTMDEVRLLTPGGELVLSAALRHEGDDKGGSGDYTIAARCSGKLDLELLQPLLAGKLSALAGGVALDLRAAGSLKRPALDGAIAIVRPLRAEVRGFAQVVAVPSGTLRLSSSFVALDNLEVSVGDATLRVGGRVTLGPGFVPEHLALSAEGDVNANLLESLAPGAVSDVSGRAALTAKVSGSLDDPQISAQVRLSEIDLRLRGISRQISVKSGTLDLTSHEVLLHDVRVVLDNEGELLIGKEGVRPGRVKIAHLRPELVWQSIDLPLAGNHLAYRDEGIQIDDLSLTVALTGSPAAGLSLAGDVRLVAGRYLQDFNVRDLVLSPRINEGGQRQLWLEQPLLRDLALALRVRTEGDGFIVTNNLTPETHIQADIGIAGTLAVPAISGEIRPTDGRIHIPGLHDNFELSANVNHVTFVPTKSIAAGDTPELNLEAQNLVGAADGPHTVVMRINGPINMATIDLSTTDGLDRNQTMLLLLSGRTTDDLNNSGQVFGMNRESALDAVGQVSRDAVSNLLEPFIDDTLAMLTGSKLNLRPTIGSDGIQMAVQAQTTRQFNLQLSYLRGFQSQEHYSATGLAWFRDYLTCRLGADRQLYPQQGISTTVQNLSLELTLEYPIRGLRALLY